MDGVTLNVLGHTLAIHGLAHNVPHAAHRLGAYRHGHGHAGVLCLDTACEAVGRAHCHRAHDIARKLRLHLQNRAHFANRRHGIYGKGRIYGGHLVVKTHVHNRSDDAHDGADTRAFAHKAQRGSLKDLLVVRFHQLSSNADAPATISLSSVVIESWRSRLYVRLRVVITSLALSVADCMAARRAACSAAAESSNA